MFYAKHICSIVILVGLALAQGKVLENSDVLNMLHSGIGESTIIIAIQKGPSKLDSTPDALIELKKAGATDSLLKAVLDAASAREVRGYINCNGVPPFAVLFSSADPAHMSVMSHIQCHELVTILEERVDQFTKVRSQTGQIGYVNASLLSEGSPPVVQHTDTQRADTSEVRHNSGPAAPVSSTSPVLGYPILLQVLQTQHIPYSVNVGGGGSNTNCTISGSTYTTGSASTFGNYTYGHATSDTNLGMHCNTRDVPPMQWQHVLNTMLVVGSNQVAYIIACDAAWRWSKCRGLMVGDKFPARMSSKGMEVIYYDKGKQKEASYSVLQMKVLTH